MNELLFIFHILLVALFSLFALRLGKSGLMAFIALQSVLANLFVIKQTTLFGLQVTCSDVFVIGSLLSLNLLQEFFGKEKGQKAIKVSFLAMLFFTLMAKIHLLYSPSTSDQTHTAFETIFSNTPRLMIASIGVYFITQQIDLHFFGWLKKRWGESNLSLRIAISLLFSQLIDTVLFSFFGLYGVVSSIGSIILMSLVIKWIAIGLSSPFTLFSRRFMRSL